MRRRHALALLLTFAVTPSLAQNTQPGAALLVAGNYAAQGRYPDGTGYSGQVVIAQDGGRVAMTWKIGTDSYQGQGLIDGRVMAVDWGADSPVIYVIMPDGELLGTWDDGLGLEKLIPR